MNNHKFFEVLDIERSGKTEEGFQLLKQMADFGNATALLELSSRYFSIEGYAYPIKQVKPNKKLSEELAKKAKLRLVEQSNTGDGDAMLLLANTYLGHWHPVLEKSFEKAEKWLLLAYQANCYFAANDLATFYQGSDLVKAKFYYAEAERHGCRVIHNDDLA